MDECISSFKKFKEAFYLLLAASLNVSDKELACVGFLLHEVIRYRDMIPVPNILTKVLICAATSREVARCNQEVNFLFTLPVQSQQTKLTRAKSHKATN